MSIRRPEKTMSAVSNVCAQMDKEHAARTRCPQASQKAERIMDMENVDAAVSNEKQGK